MVPRSLRVRSLGPCLVPRGVAREAGSAGREPDCDEGRGGERDGEQQLGGGRGGAERRDQPAQQQQQPQPHGGYSQLAVCLKCYPLKT